MLNIMTEQKQITVNSNFHQIAEILNPEHNSTIINSDHTCEQDGLFIVSIQGAMRMKVLEGVS